MKIINCVKVFLVTTSILFLSCNKTKKQSEVESFFEKYSAKMDKVKLDSFKNATVDSTGQFFEIINGELSTMYDTVLKIRRLNEVLDSFLYKEQLPYLSIQKRRYLYLAFHTYLNEGDIFSAKLIDQLRVILTCEWTRTDRFNHAENIRITRLNYSYLSAMDTFEIVLPVKYENGEKHSFYTAGYPYSLKYETADDSVSIRVVLVDKYYGNKSVEKVVDSTSYIFKVRVIQSSDTSVFIPVLSSDDKLRIGSQFELHLGSYGRIINKL